MQKWWKKILITTAFSICCMSTGLDVKAVGKDSKIEEGVKVGNIDVSGMSISEAEGAVGTFVESLKDVRITLRLEGGQDTGGRR